ncbi:MAG: sialidase family protein [Acidimicrobiales bacterium]
MNFRRWRGWAVAASVAGIALAGPGIAGAQSATPAAPANPPAASFQAQGAKISRLTKAIQLTKDEPVSTRAFSGPVMLADPANPRIIVAATAELRTRVCYLARSTDAGTTWHILSALPAPGSYPFCTHTSGGITQSPIAWGRNSTLYYALAGYNNADGGDTSRANASVLLARSTDLGTSWSTSIADNTRGLTGQQITHDAPVASVAVDTSGPKDVVYVGWRQGHPFLTGAASTSGSAVAVSTDGGVTFAKAVDLNTFSHVTLDVKGTSYPLVLSSPFLAAGNGVVVAISGAGTPTGTSIPGPSQPMPVLAARSTDQGRTWTVSAITQPTDATRAPAIAWSPKGGARGTFLLAYQAAPNQQAGESSILFTRSTDGAQTWSPVVSIDDPTVSLDTTFLPAIDVAPNGRVDVIWYDFRLQHGFSPDVYYTYSTDDGVSWAPNVRVTDQSIDYTLGVSANSDLRQPPGVASANQYAAFGWADTRLGNPTTETQDVFADVAQFSALPSNSSDVAPILAAVFGGIAAAGLILVLVLLGRRRKEGPTPPKVGEPAPVSAG